MSDIRLPFLLIDTLPRLSLSPVRRFCSRCTWLPSFTNHLQAELRAPRGVYACETETEIEIERTKGSGSAGRQFSVQDGVDNPIIRGRLHMAERPPWENWQARLERGGRSRDCGDLKSRLGNGLRLLIVNFSVQFTAGLSHDERSADAADTSRCFSKSVPRMKHFHGESSLKTWILSHCTA